MPSLLTRLLDALRRPTGGGAPTTAQLHRAAVVRGALTYDDPESGYPVFTAEFLRSRGHCCGSYCRHCPYGPQAQAEAAANPPPDTEH